MVWLARRPPGGTDRWGRRVRRIARRIVLSLGLVSLVGGPLFSLFAAPRMAGLPYDLPSRQVAQGSGVYLDPSRGYQVIGPVRLRNVHELVPGGDGRRSGVVVWTARDRTTDLDHHRKVNEATATYVLDRRTARSVACCGSDTDRHGSLVQAFPL